MNEIKNTAKGNNTKTDLTDDRICDMEVRNAKFIQQKRTATTKNGKEWKKKKKKTRPMGINQNKQFCEW